MQRFVILGVAATGLTLSCGSDTVSATGELAEICGQTEPVQLLGFEFARELGYVLATQIGQRRIVTIGYADAGPYDKQLWSVGLCGETPRKLDAGVYGVWTYQPYPDLVFVSDHERREIRVLDPTGAHAPRAVFETPSPSGSYLLETDAGLVGIWPDYERSPTGTLVLQPWPEDPWADDVEPVVLLDGVGTYAESPAFNEWDALAGGGDEVFVRTVDDELVRVSLDDGSVEVIATDVRMFQLGYDAYDEDTLVWPRRYLVWQRSELTNDNPDSPEGEILLLDRETGDLRSVGETALAYAHLSAIAWSSSGLLQLPFPAGTQDGELVLRLYDLASHTWVDVSDTLEPMHMLADDRHLIVRDGKGAPLRTLDVQTGELGAITEKPASFHYSYDVRGLGVLPDGEEGELWLVTDGDGPRLIAERATWHHWFMPDGRLLSGVDVNEKKIGELVVIDPDTLEEQLIDVGVFATHYSRPDPSSDDTTVIYGIAVGTRRGLWLARLKPR
jgi:hypothetical protein